MNSQSVTGIGMTARTTTANWGASGQFPTSITNALSQTTSRGWNYSLGLPASATDPNGLVTSWTYDSFGRRTNENRPDGTSTAWTWAPCTTCGFRVKYTVTQQPKTTAAAVIRTDEFRYDAFDQEVTRLTPQAAGGNAQVRYDRDTLGRITRSYVPYWSGGATNGYADTYLDVLGRVTGTALVNASGVTKDATSTSYNGLSATTTDALGHATTRTSLAWGPPTRMTDAAGGSTNYLSNGFGQLTRMTDAYNTIVMQAEYNPRGMPTSVTNVNRGKTTLVPNALGEVTSETTAKGQIRSFVYDPLGRLTSRTEPEGTSNWTWGTSTHNSASAKYIGGLKSLSGPGYSETYTNDASGRLITQTVTVGGTGYALDYGYNTLGLLDTLTYPTSTSSYRLKLQCDYANGIPTAIKDFNAPTTVIWSRAANDARGDVIDETLGANLKVITGRDALTGRMDYRLTGLGGGSAIQNLAYVWDNAGNLTQRGDANQAGSCSVGGLGGKLCETFSYDTLDRLDTVARNGTQTLDANYDLSGNLTSRSDVGSYSYHATKKHAVIAAGTNTYAYDANGNVTTRNGATLGWASYDLPTSLVSGSNSASFAYAPDRSRYQQTAVTAGVTETTLYIAGLLEKVTKPSIVLWKHYVTAPTGVGAVYVRRSDGSSDTYYVTTDHLGSTDKLLKAATGTVQVAESFAPFGARRGSAWQGAPSAADLTAISNSTPDGFTGHEMLDGVGLIHMRGRVYDPTVGRFLSVDPIVRDADASQSWNGYGYVEGRTLSWTDPSGWSGCAGNANKNCDLQPAGDSLPTITVTARRYAGGSVRSISDFALMNGGLGNIGGRDCPAGLEEVVVDGQRGQPPVPVVPLTFVPLSITPPNSARFSRLLNAAEAENRNCMVNCMKSKKPYIYAAAAAAAAATTGDPRLTVAAAVAGGLAGLSDSQGHNPFGSGTFAVAAAHAAELFRNPTGMGAFVFAPGAALAAELVGNQFSGARGVLAGSAAAGAIDSIPAALSMLRTGAVGTAAFRIGIGTVAPAAAASLGYAGMTWAATSDCESQCSGP